MSIARYQHEGREVEAMRFVGNGPEIAAWLGLFARADGCGTSGSLRVVGVVVEAGDWVVRDGAVPRIVAQAAFGARYRRVEHANVE